MALKIENRPGTELKVSNNFPSDIQLYKEGSPLGFNPNFYDYIWNPAVPRYLNTGDQIYFRKFFTSAVKATYKSKLILSATSECIITGFFTNGYHSNIGDVQGYDNASSSFTVLIPAGGGTEKIDLPMLFFNAQVNVTYKMLSPGFEPICTIAIRDGINLTADFDYHFPINAQVISDSSAWYGLGYDANANPILGDKLFSNQLKEMLGKDGVRVRMINQGFGGSKSDSMNKAMREGLYNLQNIGLVMIKMGLNDFDANSGLTPVPDFKARLLAMISFRDRTYSKAVPLVFIGMHPSDTPGRVGNLATARAAISEVANDVTIGGAANNVWYFDTSSVISLNPVAANDTNFALSERAANSRLHLGDIGHGIEATGLYNFLKSEALAPKFYNYWKGK